MNSADEQEVSETRLSRRGFIRTAAALAALGSVPFVRIAHAAPLVLPALPYRDNALERSRSRSRRRKPSCRQRT
jgi:hypothetical protein